MASANLHESDPKTLADLLQEWNTDELKMTTLEGRKDRQQIIDDITIDRFNLRSLDPSRYVGWVHYLNLPLNETRSDLAARFKLRKSSGDQIGLELLDIHVL